MNAVTRVFPRLPRATAREIFQSLEGKTIEDLREKSRSSHPRAQIPSGSIITSAELESFRDNLRTELIDDHLSRSTDGRGNIEFDQRLGEHLLRVLPMTPYEAADPRVWHFLSLVLLPEIGPWRFPLLTEERFIGPPIRNVLGRTWWRAHLLGSDLGTGESGADPLNEDELYTLVEKTTIGFDEVLVKMAADAIYRFQKASKSRNEIVREFTKILLRTVPAVDVVSLDEDSMTNFLDTCIKQASEIVSGSTTRSMASKSSPKVTKRHLSLEADLVHPRPASGICPAHSLHPKGKCPICDRKVSTVFFTSGGHAFHANKTCPSLLSRSKGGIESAKVADARGRGKEACHQCVNGVCVRCAIGKHDKCDPKSAGIAHCECALNDHNF
jgi:hypothetical protein